MSAEVIEKCKLLVKNRDTIHQVFHWEGDSMILAGSSFYAGINKEADLAKLKECENIMKKKTGILSEFRGNVKMPVLCKMAVSEDPEACFDELQSIVTKMKGLKWIDSEYKVLAAMTLYDHQKDHEYDKAIEKMAALYQKMKDEHPWLTSSEDIPFVAMMAVSGTDTDALCTEMEACYQQLKEIFMNKNAVQSLSHVLAVDTTETKEKCRRVEQLFNLMKDQKHKFGTGYELSVLGTLSLLDQPFETIVSEYIEADEYLLKQKGFGNFVMGEKTRRMYAALMVMDTYMPDTSKGYESILDSILTMVIAMEVCMVIVMTSCCTTISTSH